MRDRHGHHRPQARGGRAAGQRAAPPLGGRRPGGGRAAARHERHRHRLQPERGGHDRRSGSTRSSASSPATCRCAWSARTAATSRRTERPGYRAFLTGEPQLGIVAGHPKPDGDMHWLSINCNPIIDPQTGAPFAVAASFADITEQRRAERLKEEFFALVSHELRTPLTSIAATWSWSSTPRSPSSTRPAPLPDRRRAQRASGCSGWSATCCSSRSSRRASCRSSRRRPRSSTSPPRPSSRPGPRPTSWASTCA